MGDEIIIQTYPLLFLAISLVQNEQGPWTKNLNINALYFSLVLTFTSIVDNLKQSTPREAVLINLNIWK